MKIITTGRQIEVSDKLKLLFTKKLAKFDKYFNDDAVAYITLRKDGKQERLELTISSSGTLYRSEETADSFQTALDSAIDTIERQIRKNKTRLEKRLREGAFVSLESEVQEAEEGEFNIRTKSFSFKPMSVEEAILQMNLLEHQFFVFTNDKTNEVNVVYKKKNNNYGLIIPD